MQRVQSKKMRKSQRASAPLAYDVEGVEVFDE